MMRISKEPMTVDQLRRYVNPRFRTIRNDIRALKRDIVGITREQRSLREYVREAAVETRRHFDIVAESLRSEIRLVAEAVDGHSQRLDNHETRIRRLEQLP
jgi:hypothetical protein